MADYSVDAQRQGVCQKLRRVAGSGTHDPLTSRNEQDMGRSLQEPQKEGGALRIQLQRCSSRALPAETAQTCSSRQMWPAGWQRCSHSRICGGK